MATNLKDAWQKLKGLKECASLSLEDKELPVFPSFVVRESLSASPSIPLGGTTAIKLQATSSADLTVFTSIPQSKDKDPDAVLLPRDSAAGNDAPPPLVEGSPSPRGEYWVKYGIEGKLDESIGAPVLANLKLGFDTSETLRFCDYRLHPPTSILGTCVEQDMRDGQFALTLDDIKALQPGEAISLRRTASISASVTLSWADIFTEALGTLASLANLPGLGVEVDLGASISVSITAADDFRVVFAGLSDDRVRVAITKAKTKKLAAGGKLGVTAQIAGFDQADAQKLLEDLLGSTYTSLGQEVQQAASNRLLDTAKEKAAAGFEYSYSRVSTDSVLFQGIIKRTSLTDEVRLSFMRGDLGAVLARVQQKPPAIALEQYLRRQTLEKDHAWGFSLAIGSWKLVGQDKTTFISDVSLDINDRKKVAYEGLRSYNRGDLQWTTDFKADMDHFHQVPKEEPPVSEFQLGFHLLYSPNGPVNDTNRGTWLDLAKSWKVVEGDSATKLQEVLGSLRGNIQLDFQLLMDQKAVNSLFIAGDASKLPDFSSALATAMPWVKDLPQRRDIPTRTAVYKGPWVDYLNLPPGEDLGTDPGNTVEAWLRGAGVTDSALLGYERLATSLDTFKEIVASIDNNAPRDGFRTIRDRVQEFQKGLKNLWERRAQPHNKVIPSAFLCMTGMGSQHILCWALGIYLLNLADQYHVLPLVVRSLTIKASGAPSGKILVYGNGART